MGNFTFNYCIDVLKASTGKWTKCFFPYNEFGNPLSWETINQDEKLVTYLLENKEILSNRSIENKEEWYLFGRTQAINDVYKDKIAINTIIKDLTSLKISLVPKGKGVYSGLYILTNLSLHTIQDILYTYEFLEYIKTLGNYKSGGYYTFNSRDIEKYLNYKINTSRIYDDQQRISNNTFNFV